jgi:hypothetical protein
MSDFTRLIPDVPAGLSPQESAAFQQRRQHCLELLAAQVAENPDYEPDAYHLTLYCGEVTGGLSSQDVMEALQDHYAQLQAGTRQWLPNDRLDDPRLDYHQPGESDATWLIGAVYDAWQATYVPLPLPVFGPHLLGQEPVLTVPQVLTKTDRYALIEEAWGQVTTQLPQLKRAEAVNEKPAQQLGLFEREVLSSYLAREVNAYQARQLLATHRESRPHRFHC